MCVPSGTVTCLPHHPQTANIHVTQLLEEARGDGLSLFITTLAGDTIFAILAKNRVKRPIDYDDRDNDFHSIHFFYLILSQFW
jgi:hypothetical protein